MSNNAAVEILPLATNWRMVRSEPSAATEPSAVDWVDSQSNAVVPGTVASTLLGTGRPGDEPVVDFDDYDWWYECEFTIGERNHQSAILRLDGLATIAEVWLNGKSIHSSRNMFRAFRLNVKDLIKPTNRLSIVFRSLNQDLKTRRPRGRWKTNLIARQQLRWIRTTLLGRIPGWTPAIAPVGPWKDVSIVCGRFFAVSTADVHTRLSGTTGTVQIEVVLNDVAENLIFDAATINVLGKQFSLPIVREDDRVTIHGEIGIEDVPPWYPHTHGAAQLHDYTVAITTSAGTHEIAHGRLGFRTVNVNRSEGRLAFAVNGKPLFARGGCWTTNDIISLVGKPDRLQRTLRLIRESGANMIRVGGTMVYEADLFYELCDELGITVWQDFMFANMDYPAGDPEFRADISAEISAQLCRLRAHPSVVAYCGSSEVEQQAAMFGISEDVWKNELFYELIPQAISSTSPGTPYFPSSPCEGALPFHNSSGPAHYFGVGAYKQTIDDLAKSDVSFASECLAFSNVPSDKAMQKHFGTTMPAVHHPDWKSGVPRDSAAGWDFEDVRDHYIGVLYGIDPVELRYSDRERYIAISQVVTGEIMERVYGFWRDDRSRCQGGLLWFLNDIVPGAGWGLLDSDGCRKPLFYFLKRCWSNVSMTFADNGMDGLDIRIVNESEQQLRGSLDVRLLQRSRITIADAAQTITVAANETGRFSVDALLGRFLDTTYRYRFGPVKHDVVVASLSFAGAVNPLVACYYPGSHDVQQLDHAEISVQCESADNEITVCLRADAFLKHVRLRSLTHEFSDNFFELPPETDYLVTASRLGDSTRAFKGELAALNLANPIAFR